MLTLYYYEELTMKEIGLTLGVVESRVSQIHSSAVLRLRGTLAALRGVRTEARHRGQAVRWESRKGPASVRPDAGGSFAVAHGLRGVRTPQRQQDNTNETPMQRHSAKP